MLCLNIGVDPPDVVKISPCARLECWVDPLSMQPAKALETIGEARAARRGRGRRAAQPSQGPAWLAPAAQRQTCCSPCLLPCGCCALLGRLVAHPHPCRPAPPAPRSLPAGKNLQAQYERWQPRAKYKMHLDPTLDDVKKLAASCRRTAKQERVLFHYNGHGVPRPTVNGEIWVFNSRWAAGRRLPR